MYDKCSVVAIATCPSWVDFAQLHVAFNSKPKLVLLALQRDKKEHTQANSASHSFLLEVNSSPPADSLLSKIVTWCQQDRKVQCSHQQRHAERWPNVNGTSDPHQRNIHIARHRAVYPKNPHQILSPKLTLQVSLSPTKCSALCLLFFEENHYLSFVKSVICTTWAFPLASPPLVLSSRFRVSTGKDPGRQTTKPWSFREGGEGGKRWSLHYVHIGSWKFNHTLCRERAKFKQGQRSGCLLHPTNKEMPARPPTQRASGGGGEKSVCSWGPLWRSYFPDPFQRELLDYASAIRSLHFYQHPLKHEAIPTDAQLKKGWKNPWGQTTWQTASGPNTALPQGLSRAILSTWNFD